MKIFLAITLALCCMSLSARDFTVDGITYTVIDEDEKTVQTKEGTAEPDPEDSSKSVYIPGNDVEGFIWLDATVKDEAGTEYTLTKIAPYSFCSNKLLLAMWLPETVTEIGEYAYYGCGNMMRVYVPDGLSSIGKYAFFACFSMSKFTVPEKIFIIDEGTFAGCGLENITFPEGLMAIGEYAFMACTSLKEVWIPDNVFIMGTSCFLGCTDLTTLYLPADMMFTDSMMFAMCSKISTVYYPAKNPTTAPKNIFADAVYAGATLYVPQEATETVSTATPWRYFSNVSVHDFAAIDDIAAESPLAPVEYYDISGRRIISPTPGSIVIKRQGSHIEKITF